jgi:low affinity Fe/Cu permease
MALRERYPQGAVFSMTDAQLVAIAITILTVLAGTLINNSRIGDINHRLGDVKEVLRAEMKLVESRMDTRFTSIDHKLDEILRIIGNHETRITTLEQRPR